MSEEISSPEGTGTSKLVILSERNEMVRTAESMYLEARGYRVQAVGCVNRYLTDETRPAIDADLVIIDYCMDCVRGPAGCIAGLRRNFAGAPILMLCADTRVMADGDLAATVDGILYKPTSPTALMEKIADLTSGDAPSTSHPAGSGGGGRAS